MLPLVVNRILDVGEVIVLVYFVGVNAWYLALLVSSMLELRSHILLIRGESRHLLLSSTLSPTISILAPAFNEEASIEVSLRALLALKYPSLEVIVISDGSKDRTVDVLIERFDLVQQRGELTVAQLPNGAASHGERHRLRRRDAWRV